MTPTVDRNNNVYLAKSAVRQPGANIYLWYQEKRIKQHIFHWHILEMQLKRTETVRGVDSTLLFSTLSGLPGLINATDTHN